MTHDEPQVQVRVALLLANGDAHLLERLDHHDREGGEGAEQVLLIDRDSETLHVPLLLGSVQEPVADGGAEGAEGAGSRVREGGWAQRGRRPGYGRDDAEGATTRRREAALGLREA